MIPVMSVLVVLAAWLSGAGRAEASCGDWLAGHHRAAEAPEAMRADGESGETASPRPAGAPQLPRCDGPACRGVPFLPPLPRDLSFDAPRHDPADRSGLAMVTRPEAGRPFLSGSDRKPVSVVPAVPIRPPRRASLQA